MQRVRLPELLVWAMTEAAMGPVCLLITTLELGGAQETVLALASGLSHDCGVTVLAGPERDRAVVEEFERRGIPLKTVPGLRRAVSPWHDLVALLQLTRQLRRLRPQVLHTHSSKAGVLGRLAGLIARVPVVVHTVHGWSFHSGMRAEDAMAYRWLERFLAGIADALVVVTSDDRRLGLEADIGEAGKYVLIRSGIDLGAFSADPEGDRASVRKELGLAADARVVGSVGRLSRQKDPVTFLRAAEKITASFEDARFILVGDGPLRSAVDREAHRLGLGSRLVLTGSRRDIPRLLRSFDVFVLSSRWEGLPRVILEAMATGVPVVATGVNGVTEVVEDDRTGLLVESGDPAALAAATCRILGDSQLADRLRAAAHYRLDEFRQESMIEQTRCLYDRLVSQKRPS